MSGLNEGHAWMQVGRNGWIQEMIESEMGVTVVG